MLKEDVHADDFDDSTTLRKLTMSGRTCEDSIAVRSCRTSIQLLTAMMLLTQYLCQQEMGEVIYRIPSKYAKQVVSCVQD